MNPESFNKVFVGSGLMAEIFLHALIYHKGESPQDFYILGKKSERCKKLMEKYKIQASTNFNSFISNAKVIILAVDHCDVEDIPEIVSEIRDKVPPNILINSVTPYLKIEEIEKYFPNHPVMRLGISFSAISGNNIGSFVCGSVTPEDTKNVARFLIESLGTLIESENEEEFEKISDIIYAMSCGNYLTFNCLVDSVIKLGLNPDKAEKIVSCIFRGTGATFDKKFYDDILKRMFDFSEIFKIGLKLQSDFGMIKSIDDAIHLDSVNLKNYFENIRNMIMEYERERPKLHFQPE